MQAQVAKHLGNLLASESLVESDIIDRTHALRTACIESAQCSQIPVAWKNWARKQLHLFKRNLMLTHANL